jgi:hypothetical protein
LCIQVRRGCSFEWSCRMPALLNAMQLGKRVSHALMLSVVVACGFLNSSAVLVITVAEELVRVLHLPPLVLRLAHILMAYATGAHAQAAPSTDHYSSLSPPALRDKILSNSIDRRETTLWPEVGFCSNSFQLQASKQLQSCPSPVVWPASQHSHAPGV